MDGVTEGRRAAENYYVRDSMKAAEKLDLVAAGEVEGLGDEIAVLRAQLKQMLSEATEQRPLNRAVMVRLMDTLMKAVATEYRLSPKARKDLADNFAAVMNHLADQMLPAGR